MKKHVQLLIIGAGPYGLSLAIYAKDAGIQFEMLGKSMELWKANMPQGMKLRSDTAWHLDPLEEHTFVRYVETNDISDDDLNPISRKVFLGYTQWLEQQKDIQPTPVMVKQLDKVDGQFKATLENGDTLTADHVVVSTGFGYFQNHPPDLIEKLPQGRWSHTGTIVDFAALKDRRCLIIGGRQSALEWAALIHEAGAAEVHLCHRHPTPELKESNWSWVPEMVKKTVDDPGWFRHLSEEEQKDIAHRFWQEGRLKLEPWLGPRLDHDTVYFWPNTQVADCTQNDDDALNITLEDGNALEIDFVVLATGYQVNVERLPFIKAGNCLSDIQTKNGFPCLNEHFQSSVEGLYFISLPATQDFGPFFGFTVGCTATAKALGKALKNKIQP